MPNWCANTVTFRHKDRAQLERIIKGYTGDGLFKEFLPTPTELLEGEGWYDWNVENWGTKWDVSDDYQINIWEDSVSLSFDTAWSPPIDFYQHMTELDFGVDAKFWEPGIGFAGYYTSEDGITEFEDPKTYPQDIIDEFGIEEWEEEEAE
jgi:hypothetical protein